MGGIRSSANETWRDYVTNGVPSSGAHEPVKSEIRATMGLVEDQIATVNAGNGSGLLTYETIAAMNADTTQPDNATAQTLEDSNLYRWDDGEAEWVSIGPNAYAARADLEAADRKVRRIESNLDFLSAVFHDVVLDATPNTAILNATGLTTTTSGRLATDFIEVNEHTVITRFDSSVASGTTAPYAFYDEDSLYLGYSYSAVVEGAQTYAIADAPSGTKYVRLTAVSSAAKLFVYDQRLIERYRDALFSAYGTPKDVVGALTNQYIHKDTGVITSAGSLRLSGPHAVTAGSYICSGGGLIADSDASQCVYGFFDAEDEFLGYYNPRARWQSVKVGEHYPTATAVYVTQPSTDLGAVYVLNAAGNAAANLDTLASGLLVDYFAPSLLSPGRLTSAGAITQSTSTIWNTTDYIAVVEGQKFYLTTVDITASGGAPVVAGYDEDKLYTGALLAGSTNDDFVDREIVIPAGVSFIRATVRIADNSDVPLDPPGTLISVRAAQPVQESASATSVSYLAPDAAYGRVNEPVFLYGAGVVGDPAVALTFAPSAGGFNSFQGARKVRLVKDDTDTVETVAMRVAIGKNRADLGSMAVRLTNTGTAVSPGSPMNIVCIGDSTTSQLAGDEAEDGNGTWVNEMSRQLTGTGASALVVGNTGSINEGSEWGPVVSGDIRAALALTNIHFRGTRGGLTIKHEGRGGWRASQYLERTNVEGGDGKTNAFWDPTLTPWGPAGTTWQFSMQYYIENNGWDVGSTVSGVELDGANLLVIIALGWNDYGSNTDASVSAGHMAALADRINTEYPAAKVWMPSLWAPPQVTLKQNTGSVVRWYSPAEIFDLSTRAFGEAYRDVCSDRAWCDFVQVSHQMDPDYCFSKTSIAPSRVTTDSTFAYFGTGDNVHMRRRGYRMFADVMADKFLYDYCRP
jgi:hypothetical protein